MHARCMDNFNSIGLLEITRSPKGTNDIQPNIYYLTATTMVQEGYY